MRRALARVPRVYSNAGRLAAAVMALGLPACAPALPESAPRGAADERTPVHLSATEREHLRLGMRTYLESTEVVVEALAGGKLAEVAASARKSGSAALRDTSPGTALQMPAGFLLLATDTHRRFDELASAASAGASRRDIGRQLRDILANCTACHASYRIAPE